MSPAWNACTAVLHQAEEAGAVRHGVVGAAMLVILSWRAKRRVSYLCEEQKRKGRAPSSFSLMIN